MIKDILVNIECDKSRDSVRDYAISIAETYGAHLTGVTFANCAENPNYMMLGVPSDILAQILTQQETAAREAIARFEEAARRSDLSVAHRLITRDAFGSSDTFSAMARHFDLSVIMQSDDEKRANNDTLIHAALFNSGRPVIVVPYIQKAALKLDRIVCCWDGSRAAARAVNDALPFLKKARTVELFIVDNEKTSGPRIVRGVEIGNHLARHDLKVDVAVEPAADLDVANAILSHTADCSADLIVMGGYGHSRMREFVLGGATRGILEAMTIPVLMSH
jgi:nucleotide-binding universal stress UspA family protein